MPDKPWPKPISYNAMHGITGEFVDTMQEHTEADPAGLLLQFLGLSGIMMGRRTGIRVGRGWHYPNLYVVLVGGTGALGRKGTSFTDVRSFFSQVDANFVRECIKGGLSSGEGFLMEVRDPITKLNDKGEVVVIDQGVDDKRACWYEPELANLFAVKGRDGNTLASHLRNAYDGAEVLRIATKNSPLRSTGPHIGLIGHITPHELATSLSDSDVYNGFANRMLFTCVKATQRLAFGGPYMELPVLADRMRQKIAFGDHIREITWSPEARPHWIELYEHIKPIEDGVVTSLSSRVEAHLVRLCLIYAILDESPTIRPTHVLAAKAVWDYCRASLESLFDGERSMLDPFLQILYDLIEEKPGLSLKRLDIQMSYPPRMKLSSALHKLEDQGLIVRARERRGEGGGRPAECFYPANRKPANELVSGDRLLRDDEVSGVSGISSPQTSYSESGVSGNTPNRLAGLAGNGHELSPGDLKRSVEEVLQEGNN